MDDLTIEMLRYMDQEIEDISKKNIPVKVTPVINIDTEREVMLQTAKQTVIVTIDSKGLMTFTHCD